MTDIAVIEQGSGRWSLSETDRGYAFVDEETGVLLRLDEATDDLLARWLAGYAEVAKLVGLRADAVRRELARRADDRATRTIRTDVGLKVTVKAEAVEYDGPILRAGLKRLVDAGKLDAAALEAACPLRPHVLKTGVSLLAQHAEAAAVVAAAKKPSTRSRGVTVE